MWLFVDVFRDFVASVARNSHSAAGFSAACLMRLGSRERPTGAASFDEIDADCLTVGQLGGANSRSWGLRNSGPLAAVPDTDRICRHGLLRHVGFTSEPESARPRNQGNRTSVVAPAASRRARQGARCIGQPVHTLNAPLRTTACASAGDNPAASRSTPNTRCSFGPTAVTQSSGSPIDTNGPPGGRTSACAASSSECARHAHIARPSGRITCRPPPRVWKCSDLKSLPQRSQTGGVTAYFRFIHAAHAFRSESLSGGWVAASFFTGACSASSKCPELASVACFVVLRRSKRSRACRWLATAER